MFTRRAKLAILFLPLTALVAAACSANGGSSGTSTAPAASSSAKGPGAGSKAVGFIFVGPKDDFGYNQAAYQGSQAVKAAFPGVQVLTAENVPETDEAARVMEGMIAKGAKIIFATSYGHLDAATQVAAVQQGNLIQGAIPPNLGTYFGTVYEPVYLAGVVAGKETKTNKLGFVYAFPITQSIENIDAFELGAQSVNPAAKTYVVNTSAWCDPAKQAEAAQSLLSQGADVITQHQDCTATVIKATEAAGKMTIGYHADASSLAPKGWLTGSQWDWTKLYVDIVQTALDGKFTGSKYNANYRVGLKTGDNPFIQSPYGPDVTQDVKTMVTAAKTKISSGSVFEGPITAQDGSMIVSPGKTLDYATIETTMTKFVAGVVGQLPKG
jgi:basic membrane protein A